jgi:hypothetical protein
MMTDKKPDQENDVLVDEPERAARYKKLFRDEVAKLRKDQGSISVIPWSSVIVPANATELERLTYVPGVVGDITEWIVSSAPRPNRMMALGAATVTVGTIIGRYVMGPTGSATHLYIIMLAPSGYGKDWPLQAGEKLMDAVGKPMLIGPDSWSSEVGLQEVVKRSPLICCFVDELGDQLSLLTSQNTNRFVSNTLGLLKKCYNAWATFHTPETATRPMVRIDWPAVSIIGAATPESFFGSLTSREVEGGLANRFSPLPYEGLKRPAEQLVPPGAQEPPPDLVAKLKLLPCAPDSVFDQTFEGRPGDLYRVPWGPGAKECYLDFSREMDKFAGEGREQVLSMRACENAARFATDIAVGRFSPTVDLEDISHCIKISKLSFEAMVGGIDRYMQEYFDFPKFCDQVAAAFKLRRFISKRDLNREFFRRMRMGFELDRVVAQLIKQSLIEFAQQAPPTGGHTAEGWKWIGD